MKESINKISLFIMASLLIIYSTLFIWRAINDGVGIIENIHGEGNALMGIMLIIAFLTFGFTRTEPEKNVNDAPEPLSPPVVLKEDIEDPDVVRARKLAEIELAKAEQLASLRIAEARGLAGVAAEVAQSEEERQRRQLEELKKL